MAAEDLERFTPADLPTDLLPVTASMFPQAHSIVSRSSEWSSAFSKGQDLLQVIQKGQSNDPDYVDYSQIVMNGYNVNWAYNVAMDEIDWVDNALDDLEVDTESPIWYKWTAGMNLTTARELYPTVHQRPDFEFYMSYKDGLLVRLSSNTLKLQDNAGLPFGVVYRLSDISYLAWANGAAHAGVEPKALSRVLVMHITNMVTVQIINDIFASTIEAPGQWPGATYQAGSVAFSTILGSPNGSAIGWMIANRMDIFVGKTISRVTVFLDEVNHWALLFYIDDKPAPAPAPAAAPLQWNRYKLS